MGLMTLLNRSNCISSGKLRILILRSREKMAIFAWSAMVKAPLAELLKWCDPDNIHQDVIRRSTPNNICTNIHVHNNPCTGTIYRYTMQCNTA